MRKVLARLFCSVDGFATGRDQHDMDWAVTHQGPEVERLGLDTIRDSDLMVLGRVTYEMFAGYWPTARWCCSTTSRHPSARALFRLLTGKHRLA